MAQNFYKKDGSYYLVGSNQKILNLQQLNQYSQAGGREVSYTPPTQYTPPAGSVAINGAQYNTTQSQQQNFSNIYQQGNTLYGTPINNNINSNTIQSGTQFNPSQLPTSASQTAIDIYTQNSLQNGQQNLETLQNQYNTLSAQQLQQTQQGIQQTQGELNTLEQQRQNDINQYRSTTDPIYNQGASEYTRMLDSLKQMDYTALVKQRLDLTNDIVNYSNMMRQELDVEASRPALFSVSQGRQSGIQQNYLSKISTAQAAQSAIDGNFNLAFDIMEKGATVIKNITADRINFLNFVSGIYDDNIADKRNKLITLTADEKEQIDSLRTKLENDIKNVEENKKIVQNLMSSPATAMIAHKAGLSLTDTPDVLAQKLQKYYVANPTLIPDSVVSLQEKFPDAGINFWDSPDAITAKLKKSAIFKAGTTDTSTTLTPNQLLDQAQAMVNSGQATDLADAISQIQNAMGGGGNVTPQDNQLLTPGVVGGQCGDYLHKIADNIPSLGDLYTDKIKKANISTKDWKVGDVLIQNVKTPYGHVSVVTAVNGNRVTVTESNWNNDEKVGTRTLTMGDKSVTGVYRGAKLKTNSQTPQKNEAVDSWVKLIQSGQAKLDGITDKTLRNKVVTALANSGNISQADAATTNIINDKIKLIDDIKNSVQGANAVGPNKLARFSATSFMTGKKQEFIGKVEQLISQGTLDALLNLKKAGGTLGALSDQERIMLQNSASKIGAWTMRDKNGRVTGYKVSEKAFKSELDNLKMLAQRAIQNAGSQTGVINSLEQYLANNPNKVSEYNSIVSSNPNLTDDEILQVLGLY